MLCSFHTRFHLLFPSILREKLEKSNKSSLFDLVFIGSTWYRTCCAEPIRIVKLCNVSSYCSYPAVFSQRDQREKEKRGNKVDAENKLPIKNGSTHHLVALSFSPVPKKKPMTPANSGTTSLCSRCNSARYPFLDRFVKLIGPTRIKKKR